MGGCGAGGMPLYNAVVNEGDQTVTAFDGLGGAKAYAATPGSCKCPLTASTVNGLICPEQSLNYATYVTGAFGSVSNFLNKPGMKIVSDAAKLWNSTIGEAITTITEPIVNLLQKAPGYSAIEGAITSAADSIFSDLASYIYPAWINDNMTGGDNFVATDGGARVVANDYAEKVMGGQPLTLQQQTAIETQADIIQEQTFKNKPLYARLFDKEDTHSLVTRLALAIPDDFHATGTNIFSKLISDPFTKIIKGFGAIFAGHTAFATAPAVADPFSITHFGIPLDNPVYNQDPEGYFATRCDSSTHTEEWNKNVKINPALGIPEHTTSDPCLLINEAASAGGGLYDSSLVGK